MNSDDNGAVGFLFILALILFFYTVESFTDDDSEVRERYLANCSLVKELPVCRELANEIFENTTPKKEDEG